MKIPSLLLKQLYTFGSLKNTTEGVRFSLKNRLSDAQVLAVTRVALDENETTLTEVQVDLGNGRMLSPTATIWTCT